MIAQYIQGDDFVDFTPNADVAAGAVVVQGDLIGVAVRPIPANALGALSVEGVFDVPKSTAGGSAIAAGATVYWDATNKVATVGASKLMGKTVKAAVDADATVRVRLFQ